MGGSSSRPRVTRTASCTPSTPTGRVSAGRRQRARTGLVAELEPLRVRVGRRRRQMLLGALLGGLALWLGSGFSFHTRGGTPSLPSGAGRNVTSHYDGELGHVVSRIAGRGALVYCWSPETWTEHVTPFFGKRSAWRGYTEANPLLTVNLSPEVCGELHRIEM